MQSKPKAKRLTDKLTFKQTAYEGKACGIYVRVSSEEFVKNANGDKERRASVQTQIQDGIKWAKEHGWDNYIVYDQDCDISGNEDAINRPAIQRIIEDIKAGKLHTIYAREHSRFVRNEKLWQIMLWDYFYPYGVDFRDSEGTDIKTNAGRMLAGLKAGQNQDFLIENARKSMRNKIEKAEKGTLRTVPPFGYGIQEIDGIRKGYIKPTEAEVIKELFTRCANGEGSQIIINDLISRGIKTKLDKHLHAANIIRWLRNPIYKGVIIYNGKEYKSPYPPIVEVELWEKAQQQINIRASRYNVDRRSASNAHLLTGLLHCGYCSDMIDAGETTTHNIFRNYVVALNKTWKNVNGKNERINYAQYRCQTKYKHHASSCPDSISLNAAYIEGEVVAWVGNMIANDYGNNLADGNNRLAQLVKQIEAINGEIEGLKARKVSIEKRYATGKSSDEEYETLLVVNKEATDALVDDLAGLEGQMEALQGIGLKEALKGLSKWDSLTMEQRKLGLHKLFDRIKVYNDRLEVYLRASPSSSITLPIRFFKQKGLRIDHEQALKSITNGNSFILSKIRA